MSTSPAQQDLPIDWSSQPVASVLSVGHLSELIEQTAAPSRELLFTAAPAALLDELGRWQRLEDLAWVGKVRALIALQDTADETQGEFVTDEVALALTVGGMTAGNVLGEALDLQDLPRLLEAVQDGRLTARHAKAVLRGLWELASHTPEQRVTLVALLLDRLDGTQTPGQLGKVLARLALTMDLQAADKRKAKADADRAVHFYPAPDGQAVLHATGPAELIAKVRASLDANLPLSDDPDEGRSKAAREFDLFVDLLTGSATPGRWNASIVVPFHSAAGGNLELADLPGLGPVLPSTARRLVRDTRASGGTLTRISLDGSGTVISVDTPHPDKASRADTSRLVTDLTDPLAAFTVPPAPVNLGTGSYRIPDRTRRVVQARDRSCTFPGCDRAATQTDLDHRIPWPRGSTTPDNLHCLCRHHHRAKQAGYTPALRPDGVTVWTSPSGWRFLRHPKPY